MKEKLLERAKGYFTEKWGRVPTIDVVSNWWEMLCYLDDHNLLNKPYIKTKVDANSKIKVLKQTVEERTIKLKK